MDYLLLKSLHIIFVVTWFAGLFYIVRLFIYQTEALDKSEPEKSILQNQFKIMTKRLWYGITWPSAVITLGFGNMFLIQEPRWLSTPFMKVKLVFVGLLFIYQLICHKQYSLLQKSTKWMSSNALRLWNELATVFLVAIVFLIVRKNTIDWLYGTIGLVIFALVLMIAIRIYKRIRQ